MPPTRRGAAGSLAELECRCFIAGRVLKFVLPGESLFVERARDCACAIDGVADAQLIASGLPTSGRFEGIDLIVPERHRVPQVQEVFLDQIRRPDLELVVTG